jgi:hypothetical protein
VAEEEATAHLFAAKLWNYDWQANATFVYYKPFHELNGQWVYPPNKHADAYHASKWMTSTAHCTLPWTDRGVEWDWLAFYWNATSRDRPNYTKLSQLASIYSYACTGTWYLPCQYQDPSPSQILGAAALCLTSQQYSRLATTMNSFGVAW